jgi:outer membrane immunogenic protein
MKKFLLGLIGAIAAVAPAAAADLPARAYTKAPAYIDPASNWTGFYVGLNAGGAWGRSDATTTTVFSPTGFFVPPALPRSPSRARSASTLQASPAA